jgi:hypothetical protein
MFCKIKIIFKSMDTGRRVERSVKSLAQLAAGM